MAYPKDLSFFAQTEGYSAAYKIEYVPVPVAPSSKVVGDCDADVSSIQYKVVAVQTPKKKHCPDCTNPDPHIHKDWHDKSAVSLKPYQEKMLGIMGSIQKNNPQALSDTIQLANGSILKNPYKPNVLKTIHDDNPLDSYDYEWVPSKPLTPGQKADMKALDQLKKKEMNIAILAEHKKITAAIAKEKKAEKLKHYDSQGRLLLSVQMVGRKARRRGHKLELEQQLNLFSPFSRPTVKGVVKAW